MFTHHCVIDSFGNEAVRRWQSQVTLILAWRVIVEKTAMLLSALLGEDLNADRPRLLSPGMWVVSNLWRLRVGDILST